MKPGTHVKVETKEKDYEGILLESYDPNIILLKLKSGYNIGIEKRKVHEIKEAKEQERGKSKEEVKEMKQKKGLPEVSIIVTGGTISSRLDYKTGAVKSLTKPEDIITLAPKINEIIKPVITSPFMIFSENQNEEHWKTLAKAVEKELNKSNIKGCIILAGTDTLHYISSALSFMLGKLNKPVILTYSQRSIDRGSTDALLNLTCSAYASLSDIAEVMIVGHATTEDNYCLALRGNKVRKMHTSRRDTFRPVNTLPIAKIHENGNIEAMQKYNKRNDRGKTTAQAFFEEKTALIKWHPNASPNILDFYIKEGYKGIIIEATGFGHVASEGKFSWLKKLEEAVKKNIVVCFAAQTIYGSLDPFVYSAGRAFHDTGILFLKDMLSETAFIKLGFLLAREKDREKVKKLMLQNLNNEFNDRLTSSDFMY